MPTRPGFRFSDVGQAAPVTHQDQGSRPARDAESLAEPPTSATDHPAQDASPRNGAPPRELSRCSDVNSKFMLVPLTPRIDLEPNPASQKIIVTQ